ncbi:MAG: hypothetical protein ACR2P5_08010 [Gammaproteobacteria bacterium]
MKKVLFIASFFALSGCAALRAEQIANMDDYDLVSFAFGCGWVSQIAPQIIDQTEEYMAEIKNRGLLTKRQISVHECNRVNVGMTKIEVIAAVGKPSDVSYSGGVSGESEQWIYRGPQTTNFIVKAQTSKAFRGYLYFDGGKLTSWQY